MALLRVLVAYLAVGLLFFVGSVLNHRLLC